MTRVFSARVRAAGVGGVVLAVAVLSSCAALGGDVASRVAEPSDERESTSGQTGQVFASHVDVGDCIAEPMNPESDGIRVRTISCREEHHAEVYAAVPLVFDDYPGDDVLNVRASLDCVERFEEFVGLSYTGSLLEISHIRPSEESWAGGDRLTLCTIYHPDRDRLAGSLRSARDPSNALRDAATGQVDRETAVDWLKIVLGDCVKSASEVSDDYHETLVPCTEPHSEEVYGQFALDGGAYPGDDEVGALADAGCTERFDEFVGQAYADSPLDFYYYSPYEESWLAGDRLVQCRIFDPEGDVTGTLRGTGIQST